MIHLSADEVHLNTLRCSLKATSDLETNAARYVHVGGVFALEGIVLRQAGDQFLVVVFTGWRGRQDALDTAHGEHESFHTG